MKLKQRLDDLVLVERSFPSQDKSHSKLKIHLANGASFSEIRSVGDDFVEASHEGQTILVPLSSIAYYEVISE